MSVASRGRRRAATAVASVALVGLAPLAGAQAVNGEDPQDTTDPVFAPAALPDWVTVTNGTVTLGVQNTGELNVPADVAQPGGGEATTDVGLRFVATGAEATAEGCQCEGWGVADAVTGVSGSAMRELGGPTTNMRVESFTATADSAVSTVIVDDGAQDLLRVVHDYHPSASPNLYEVRVTIENLSAAPVDPRYRRVVDWDTRPTVNEEWVTIQGTESSANVLFASNDGFASPDPLAGPSDLGLVGDFEDQGAYDHGALFDLGFDQIAPGAAVTFNTYYGAAATEAAADTARTAVNAAVYSYSQPNTDTGPTDGAPNTFIYAFAGLGAPPVVPQVAFTDAAASVGEAAGTATVEVRLSAAATGTVTVDYATAAGTATAGDDYTESSGTLTFAPGSTSQTFTVPVVDDTAVEGDETVLLSLANPSGSGAVLGTPSESVLTITDNDTAPARQVERWAGTDRYGTAAAIAERWSPGIGLVYVTSGLDFPDALSAGALAGVNDAPMLLVKRDSIPSVTAAALDRLQPARIVVLGGTLAVSDTVAGALAAYATADTPDEVTRLSGPNRYGTAAAVAAEFGTDLPVVYIARGTDFPDALTGGARAGLEGAPVLLTRTGALPVETKAALTAANPASIVVLGGTLSISEDVMTELEAYTDGTVTRLSGEDRYATAGVVAGSYGSPAPTVFIATGDNFPDALTSGPAAVGLAGPVLLTRPTGLPVHTAAELERLNPARIIVLGGTEAVSEDVAVALAAYLD